jgi:hypothetical protein
MAQLFVASGQAGVGTAAVWFYDSTDCSGANAGVSPSPSLSAVDQWLPISLTAPAPADARSAAVHLSAQKPGNQPSMKVLFDNVLFKKQ